MADDAELVIAGGGLNGMLLAVACAGAGLSTLVIDRQDPAAMMGDRFDGRTSAPVCSVIGVIVYAIAFSPWQRAVVAKFRPSAGQRP